MHDIILVDIDTQVDFAVPTGALYAPGAERLAPLWSRLYRWAGGAGIPVLASADAHTERDPEFAAWPPHCIKGCHGQSKLAETLLGNAVVIPNRDGALPAGWEGARQVILEKQTTDVFQTRTIGRVLEARAARRYVVMGLVTEVCVSHAVAGLLRSGRRVEVIADAVGALDPLNGCQALDAMSAAGAVIITSAALLD